MTDRNADRPGYKKTKVGWIPEEWEVEPMSDLCSIKGEYGASEPSVEFSVDLPQYIRITDITDEGTLDQEAKCSVELSDEEIEKYKIKNGDTFFARSGATVGKTYTHLNNQNNLVFAGYLIRFRPKTESLNSIFLHNFTHSSIYWKWVNSVIHVGAQPNINAKEYGSLPVPVPPMKEQRKIAEILSTWDRAIEQTQKLIDAKQRLKKGLMQQLLTGRMRFPGFGPAVEKTGELPEGWEEKRLHHLVKLNYGKSPKDILDDKGNIPVVGTSEEIRKGNKSLTKLDTIIIGRKGSIDNISYFNKPVWTIDTAFYTTDYDGIQPRFLFYLLDFTHLEKYNESTGVPSLSISILNKIQLRIPHVIEQQRIVDLISIIDKGIVDLTKYITLFQLQKRELMNKLLSGEVRVKVKK